MYTCTHVCAYVLYVQEQDFAAWLIWRTSAVRGDERQRGRHRCLHRERRDTDATAVDKPHCARRHRGRGAKGEMHKLADVVVAGRDSGGRRIGIATRQRRVVANKRSALCRWSRRKEHSAVKSSS